MAYDFNGTNQHLTVGSTPVSGVPITMAAWVRPTSVTGNRTAISVYSSTDSDRVALYFSNATPGAYTVNDGIAAGIAQSGTASLNTWGHLAGVISAANSRIAYWNGTAGSTNTTNITGLTTFNRIVIGARPEGLSNTMGEFASGSIAEVGIWNVALTAAEIASLADGMTCAKIRPQSLVFYVPLIRNLQDVRGGLTITNNNTATVANHSRIY